MKTHMKLLVAVLGFCAGCSAAGSDEGPSVTVEDIPEPSITNYQGPSFSGEMLVHPDSIIQDAVESAIPRWEKTTGGHIRIDAGGIPMHAWGYVFQDTYTGEAYDTDPQLTRHEVCGLTRRLGKGITDIYIGLSNPRCNLEIDIIHELGHVWGPPGHAPQGIMASGLLKGRVNKINEETLTWVCQKLECTEFSPE